MRETRGMGTGSTASERWRRRAIGERLYRNGKAEDEREWAGQERRRTSGKKNKARGLEMKQLRDADCPYTNIDQPSNIINPAHRAPQPE